jgi:hypothetical protein
MIAPFVVVQGAKGLTASNPANGWSMGFQGESGHLPLVMGVSGEQERFP